MNPYLIVVALHVVAVVCCAGPVFALAIASGGISAPAARQLSLVASLGLVAVLLTGGGALAWAGESLVHAWWFRISGVLFLVAGGLLGRLSGLTKKADYPKSVGGFAWASFAVLAFVVYLMEAKPF